MCIRDRHDTAEDFVLATGETHTVREFIELSFKEIGMNIESVSYTHLRAHETVLDLVCLLLLEKKKRNTRGDGAPPSQSSRSW